MSQEHFTNEILGTNAVTEASNKFLSREKLWRAAERAYDVGRVAAVPFRLAGNIAKNIVKVWDGDSWDLSAANGVFGLMGGALGGVILASHPIGWLLAVGIALEVYPTGLTLAGVGAGVVETVVKTKARTEYLQNKRAQRRANWR